MTDKNYFIELYEEDVSAYVEKKNGLNYVSWSYAWKGIKEKHPTATYKIYENQDGWNYFTDGRTCWVKTGVTVNGTACPVASGVVAITDVASASALSTLSGTVSDLSTCSGLDCTGTLVASDLNTINSDIADLKTCPGLSCQGTVVASDIASFITMADVNACGYTTCKGTVVASDIANFITMADVNACGYTTMSAVNDCGFTTMSAVDACGYTTCKGTLTASDISDMATKTWVNNCGFSKATFSLSGNVLTITTA